MTMTVEPLMCRVLVRLSAVVEMLIYVALSFPRQLGVRSIGIRDCLIAAVGLIESRAWPSILRPEAPG
jgi:hypothetical protein